MKKYKVKKEGWHQVDDLNWSKWKTRSKKKNHGLNPGNGGLPESGDSISESTLPTNLKVMFKSKSNILMSKHDENEEVEKEQDEISDEELESFQDHTSEDDDKQGLIRAVDGAHLVYKRKNEEGRYEELWMYKIDDNLKNSLDIKNDILSGTDILPNKIKSDDGLQEVEVWTAGNVQMLFITGLPQ